jgi:hypothetical protein
VYSKNRGPEHRRSPRRKLGVPARINWAEAISPQACILADISATGARLTTIAAEDLPEQFDLLLAGDNGPRRRAVVVLRKKSNIGVRFIYSSILKGIIGYFYTD